jgi:hypothetical protein
MDLFFAFEKGGTFASTAENDLKTTNQRVRLQNPEGPHQDCMSSILVRRYYGGGVELPSPSLPLQSVIGQGDIELIAL